MDNFCSKLSLLDNCPVLLTDYSKTSGMTEKGLSNWQYDLAALLPLGGHLKFLNIQAFWRVIDLQYYWQKQKCIRKRPI